LPETLIVLRTCAPRQHGFGLLQKPRQVRIVRPVAQQGQQRLIAITQPARCAAQLAGWVDRIRQVAGDVRTWVGVLQVEVRAVVGGHGWPFDAGNALRCDGIACSGKVIKDGLSDAGRRSRARSRRG
jgi:hypothetical protein